MAKWPADWAPGRYLAGLADAAMFKIYIYICRV
jgi:hypothetical protein